MSKNPEIVRADEQYLHDAAQIDLFDRSNPASVINVVEPQLATVIESAFTRCPDLFELDDRALDKKIRGRGFSNSPVINRLRLKFWMAYDTRATYGNSVLRVSHIYQHVCTPRVFWKLMELPEAVAWMLCPPVHYEEQMSEALAYGLDQMRLILEMPNTDKKGNINTRLLDLKLKITQMIDMRKHGSFLMRSEQKNLHLNLHRTVDTVSEMSIQQSMIKLEDKLRELKERDNANLTFVEQTILETTKESFALGSSGVTDDGERNAGANAPAGVDGEGFIEVTASGPSTVLEPSGEEGPT